jgi:hypothetical protein
MKRCALASLLFVLASLQVSGCSDRNLQAKADAFKLFYRERTERALKSLNRFSLSGDCVAANAFGSASVARSGNRWEVVPGPDDNNPFGKTLFSTWKLYQAMGGRDLELTLIRMFEGIVFNEAVSGHPGLTTREGFPAWLRTMDGVNGTVTRTRSGTPLTPPVLYPGFLEREILEAFFGGVVFTYRENPEETFFHLMPALSLGSFAVTYVFDELNHDPPFLRQSDCCSSFMKTQKGPWQGAYWGNHNSRDNFTDYAMGFLAAFEAEATAGLPSDLALAAHNAALAARRVGDHVVAHGNVLMTVDEWHDYETLSPAGAMNPDGEVEWQDLGSLSSCQMAYVAHAVSGPGLTWPVPETPLPGAIETSAIRDLFRQLGLPPPPLPVVQCRSLDDAFIGMTWREILDMKIFGVPLWKVTELVARLDPDLFPALLGGMMDDFSEMMLGSVVLCFYAQQKGDLELLTASLRSLENFIELQGLLAELVYGVAKHPAVRQGVAAEKMQEQIRAADEMLYKGAAYARMFGFDSPMEYLNGFSLGDARTTYLEEYLKTGDTKEKPVLEDGEIAASIEARLEAVRDRAPWRVDRYRQRFPLDSGTPYPVRRAGDGYECIGPDDEWMPAENARHEPFHLQSPGLWFEAPLCVHGTETLDCTWARLGCAPADLDGSGEVDETDGAAFESAWDRFGRGARCNRANRRCDGSDLDRSGFLDREDRAYMEAAQGCRT